jgi:hypothetical protein
MKKINEYELVISPGKIPLWRLILASALLTLVLYYLYLAATFFYYLGFTETAFKGLAGVIQLITFPLVFVVSLCMTKTILIDIDKDKLISRYQLGPFSKDVLSAIPELEYVAIFLNAKGEFEVNLWYQGNKHYKMYQFEEKGQAFKLAIITSTKLNIDLLDATEKGNSKWIDKTNL